MLNGEVLTSSNSIKNHRVYPMRDSNSSSNDSNRTGHTILPISENSDDRISFEQSRQRRTSQNSVSSNSIDMRPGEVIKRITSPTVVISQNDEILPQSIFPRMPVTLSLIPFSSNSNSNTDSINTNTNQNLRVQSTATTISTTISLTDECPICLDSTDCFSLTACSHKFCHSCLNIYLQSRIQSTPGLIDCPDTDCKETMHPSDIRRIINDENLYQRYETFMLRRFLQKSPETKWCPYADCQFALFIENSRKASAYDCPACHRPFCRHCSQIWHPDLTCQQTAAERAAQDPTLKMLMNSKNGQSDVRPCPRCKTPIEKLNDGSCNHIRCAICACEFCWLCMKEVDNLHFITPTGCTFYGKQRWSRKKTILLLLLFWILTPLILIVLLLFGTPIALIGLPIWITRRLNQYLTTTGSTCCSRFWLCLLVFLGSFLATPFLILLVILITTPAALIFVYIYVPRRYFVTNFSSNDNNP